MNIYSPKMLKGKVKEILRFVKEYSIDYEEKTYYESRFINPYEIGDIVNHRTYGRGRILAKDKNYITIIFNNGIERKFDAFLLKIVNY